MTSDEMYKLALRTAEGENNHQALEELTRVFGERIEQVTLLNVLNVWLKKLLEAAYRKGDK